MNRTRLILTRLSQSSSSSSSTTSSSSTFRNVLTTFQNTFCTATAAAAAVTTKRKQPSKNVSLYSKIAPLGNPNDVITPVLDDWVNQGKSVNATDLRFIIKDLRHYGRFTHALEVLRWMSDKKLIHVTAMDAAVRLDLIGKAYGVEEAEKFFNEIPENLRNSQVYSTLLRCFAHTKCVEKAEAVMQKMKELGFASYSVPYNAMLDLHCRTHNHDKLAAVLLDMEANNINYGVYTYSILLNAYGGDGDIEKLESVLTKMESDPELDIDWMTYAVAAKHYIGAQLGEKALESLRKSEKLVKLSKKKNGAYTYILRLYAALGKKEEVLRVWEECKKCRATNRDYMSLFRTFLMYNDVETAENIYKEWEDSNLFMDIRILNILIKIYCKNGLIEKAEALIERMKSKKSQNPDSYLWSWMSFGYVKRNQMDKAEVDIDWMAYVVVANHYITAHMEDKALESLRKSEKLVELLKKKNEAYTSIVRIYGALGKKDEVFRVWEECKKCKPTNRDYMILLRAFVKSNDVETAEKIFKDWEDSNLHRDIRIPNFLINIYCRNGLIEKAEALIERMKLVKWENQNSYMWSWMSFAYVKRNQMDKAVEAMKSALSETNCLVFRKNWLEGLVSCLKYLRDKKDSEQEQVNAIIETLKDRRLVSAKVLEKLVEYLSGKCDIKDVLRMDDEEGTSNENEHRFGDDN